MKLPLFVLGLAAVAYAQEDATAVIGDVASGEITPDVAPAGGDATFEVYAGPIGFPPGIAAPPAPHLPKKGPPAGAKQPIPIWHPPHHGVDIDDCDDEDADDWHWAWRKEKPKPDFPPHKWTTSTVTATKTKTVIKCEDNVKECPDHPKTKLTTTTVEVTTTICPVPVTEVPHPAPKPTHEKPAPPPATKEAPGPVPPKPTAAEKPPAPPAAPSSARPSANASGVPTPPVVVAAAPKNAAGILGAVAALVAALL